MDDEQTLIEHRRLILREAANICRRYAYELEKEHTAKNPEYETAITCASLIENQADRVTKAQSDGL